MPTTAHKPTHRMPRHYGPLSTLGPWVPAKWREDAVFWLNRASHRAQAQAFDVLARLDIDPRYYVVLLLLEEAQPLQQREICAALNMDPAIMVELVEGLEQAGLALRKTHAVDGRAYQVRLSAAGRRLLHKVARELDPLKNRILENLTAKERAQLLTLLRKLSQPLS